MLLSQLSVCTVTTPLLSDQGVLYVVNPRRACAARVTVVVLCVCVCVCVCPGRSPATHATKRQTRHTHGLSILVAPEKFGVFRIMASFRR